MAWTALARMLPKKIRQLGLEQVWHFSLFKGQWDKIIEQAVGVKFVGRSRPAKLTNGALIVDCLNSVWANELRLREGRILEEIRRSGAKITVSKISFIS